MKLLTVSATLLLALLLAFPAGATPLDDKVAALKAAIKADAASKPKSDSTAPETTRMGMTSDMIVAGLDQMVAQADNPVYGANLETQLTQLLAAYPSEAVQKAGKDLIDEIHAERKAHADKEAAEMTDLLKHVSDEINQAKKPEDLDGLLVDLQKYQDSGYGGGYGSDNAALYRQVSSAFEFTKLWQNYLSHLSTGQGQAAYQDLQSLSQNNYGVGIMPRSKILAMLSPAAAASTAPSSEPKASGRDILQGIKTLDDMRPALEKMNSMQSSLSDYGPASGTLASAVQTYENLKAGLPANVSLDYGNNNPYALPIGLRKQLLNFVLQHYFTTYKGTPPAADGDPNAFIDQVVADAVAREDWPLLQKAYTARNFLNRSSPLGVVAYNSSNSSGVDDLITASNQEAAGQYALAVSTYQAALRVPDPDLPAKVIGDKLAALKRDHPTEYQQGTEMLNTQSTQRYSSPYGGAAPGMPSRPGMPGYPGYGYPGYSKFPAGLPIPAATNQTATPSAPSTAPATNAPASQ